MPIYELALRGALHVGEMVGVDREATLEWLPSDSLFGALVTAWAATGVDVAARLSRFTGADSPLRITSAFPMAGGVRFAPAPAALQVKGLDGKRAKRVRWLSQMLLDDLRGGKAGDTSEDNFLHDGALWLTPAEAARLAPAQPLWQSQIVPRVTVDRISQASNLFHAGRVSFMAGGGLWFAVRGPETAWVEDALNVLSDAGLGGLRNYGHGVFAWTKSADELPDAPAQGPGLCLSRYAPTTPDEIQQTVQRDGAAYRFVTVGGWCSDDTGQPWRRRAVRLLAEGAILPEVSAARGNLIEVQPNLPPFAARKVYRYAFPFFIAAGNLA